MAVANDADMLDASCDCKMLLLALIPVVVLLSKAGQPVVVVVVVVLACGFRTLFAPVCMLTSVSMAFHVAFVAESRRLVVASKKMHPSLVSTVTTSQASQTRPMPAKPTKKLSKTPNTKM